METFLLTLTPIDSLPPPVLMITCATWACTVHLRTHPTTFRMGGTCAHKSTHNFTHDAPRCEACEGLCIRCRWTGGGACVSSPLGHSVGSAGDVQPPLGHRSLLILSARCRIVVAEVRRCSGKREARLRLRPAGRFLAVGLRRPTLRPFQVRHGLVEIFDILSGAPRWWPGSSFCSGPFAVHKCGEQVPGTVSKVSLELVFTPCGIALETADQPLRLGELVPQDSCGPRVIFRGHRRNTQPLRIASTWSSRLAHFETQSGLFSLLPRIPGCAPRRLQVLRRSPEARACACPMSPTRGMVELCTSSGIQLAAGSGVDVGNARFNTC